MYGSSKPYLHPSFISQRMRHLLICFTLCTGCSILYPPKIPCPDEYTFLYLLAMCLHLLCRCSESSARKCQNQYHRGQCPGREHNNARLVLLVMKTTVTLFIVLSTCINYIVKIVFSCRESAVSKPTSCKYVIRIK